MAQQDGWIQQNGMLVDQAGQQDSDADDWTTIRWRASSSPPVLTYKAPLIRQNSQLVLYALWDPQPLGASVMWSRVLRR